MFVAYRYQRRMVRAAGAFLLLSLPLGGCATSTGSSLMDARAEAPMPPSMPAKKGTYLPVEDLPPPREQPAMTDAERSKLQNELIAARDRQAAAAKAQAEQ
ncbi:hypothetical protein UP09_26195 [Bradyrhizobium sp. LTSP885]|uniref:hypothetical protein n=1 Tax=Bradyrhizobium sp. LTSP885 TaxID=1619232 RepID=UPI0005C8620A|nr:hypothetical protein [Bradyrhizobium sp. LTSP885]KJC39332.1 hypothetical protein UP09_26195 [Bradyrhizobium sp. LTSP885]